MGPCPKCAEKKVGHTIGSMIIPDQNPEEKFRSTGMGFLMPMDSFSSVRKCHCVTCGNQWDEPFGAVVTIAEDQGGD